MLKRICRIGMATVVLVGLGSGARAQNVITSVTQPSGPGGTGATAIDNQYTDQGITGLLDVDLTFTKVAPISFSFDVDSAGGYTLHANSGFNPDFTTGIVNDTGQAWTGFIFSVDTSLGAGPNGLQAPAGFSPLPNSPNGEIVLVGGPLPSGDTFNVIYGVGTPAAMTVNVTFTPLSVPEPSSVVLLGMAATVGAIVIYTRRRRLRAGDHLPPVASGNDSGHHEDWSGCP